MDLVAAVRRIRACESEVAAQLVLEYAIGVLGPWHPIETAPKEGRILVWNAFHGVYSSEFTVEYEDDDMPIAERKVKWSGYPLGLTSIGLGRWYCEPSYWAPLPDGPMKAMRPG